MTGSKADRCAVTLRNRSEPPERAAPSQHEVQFMVKVLNPVAPRPTLSAGSSARTGWPQCGGFQGNCGPLMP